MEISLLPRLHPLINLQLPREGPCTSQNHEVASRLQHAKSITHFCLTYNVTVLICKFTKAAQVLPLHKSLFHSIVVCLSSTRMLLAHQQTSENEQTKAYVRTTVSEWAGCYVTMDTKKLSSASFCSEYNQAIKPWLLILRGVWPG